MRLTSNGGFARSAAIVTRGDGAAFSKGAGVRGDMLICVE